MEPERELFECVVEPGRDALIVHPIGELDIESVIEFNEVVAGLPLDGFARLILDLRGLEFCDSTGLHAILALARGVSDEIDFGIIRGPGTVQRVFAVTGVEDALPFVDAPDGGRGGL